MGAVDWTRIKKYSAIFTNSTLIFYVIYCILMWEVSLKIKYNYVIIFACIIFSLHVLICAKCNHLKIFGRNSESVFSYIKPIDYIVLIFLITNSLWIFLVPKLNSLPVGLAIQEAGILLVFIVYFPLAILIRMGEVNFSTIKNVFFWTTFFLACWYASMWCAEKVNPGMYQGFLDSLKRCGIFKVGDVYKGWSVIRIVLGNCVLLLPGLIMSITRTKKITLINQVVTAIFTFAILSTFLKSLWFGLAFSLLILLVYCIMLFKKVRNYNVFCGIITVFITVMILNFTVFDGAVFSRASSSFANSYGQKTTQSVPASSKLPPSQSSISNSSKGSVLSESNNDIKIRNDSIDSNTEKLIQMKKLLDKWKNKPLFGFGYGSYIKGYLRSQTAFFAYEMTFFALLMKIGIAGILVWILLAISVGRNMFVNSKKSRFIFVIWLSIAVGYLISIQTNPLLFTANSFAFVTNMILCTVSMEKSKSIVSKLS